MGKKDSPQRKIQQFPKTFPKKGGIGAVLVRKKHKTMGCQVDEGIAQYQRPAGAVKEGRFCFAGAGKRDGSKTRWAIRENGLPFLGQIGAGPVMVSVGFDNQDRGGWLGRWLGPMDWIKKNRSLGSVKAGRPELCLAGGIVGMPGKEAVAVGCERTRRKAQGTIFSGWRRTGWRKGGGRLQRRPASAGKAILGHRARG